MATGLKEHDRGSTAGLAPTRRVDTGLPRGHVRRPRLVELLARARLGTILAGGGWGKTTLALEVAWALEHRTAAARLEQRDGDPGALRTALRRGLRRSGLSDLVAALDEVADPAAALDALVDALARDPEPVLLIVDEIEHASEAGVDSLTALAVDLPQPHRMLLVGRSLPARMRAATDGLPVVEIGPKDLAFATEETIALARAAGISLLEPQAEALTETTGGWAAALTVALERLRTADDLEDELARTTEEPRVLGDLVAELVAELEPDVADALVQLAHVVPVPLDAVDGITGIDTLVERAARAGIPFDLRRDGWVGLSGPVRELLTARAPLSAGTARRTAAVHEALGDASQAVRLLVGAGEPAAAAGILAALSPASAGRLDYYELNALVTAIGSAVERHPRALLHLARACEAAAEARVRTEALARAAAGAGDDAVLAREIEAERARDLVRDGRVDEAAMLAERLLAETGPDEPQTRVRALHVLGRTHAWRGDPSSLAAAEPLLLEAAELYLAIGNPLGSAHALLGLAYDVYTLGWRGDEAVACLERAAAVVPPRARLRGVILDFHGEALADLGRDAEAEAALEEADRVGRLLGDARTVAYSAWVRARIAARRGETERTRALLEQAERSRGDWFDHHSGAEFLAEAAALANEVGLVELGEDYLRRARLRRDEAPRYVLLAEGAIEARTGDPDRAEALLTEALSRSDLEARARWRAILLRALAAARAGDTARAASLAREGFDLAAGSGHPDLALRCEPALSEALLPLAAEASGGVTSRPLESPVRMRVTALGSFQAARGTAPLELPPGRPWQLVALLAAHEGRLPTERAIEALWPGVEAESGRKRLRNVLSRLREAAGEVVVREDAVLALAPGTDVDVARFAQEAERALAARARPEARARAQAALALYAGELLPGHRYEDWAIAPRERLRSLALRLVDLLAETAEQAGDLDDAVRLLERGIEWDELDEGRHLRAARVLLAQGRRGRALDVLRRAAAALHTLGLEPSDEHRQLVRAARR